MCIKSQQGLRMDKSIELESIHCPICGNEKLRRVSKKGQFGLPCYVSICPSDGLVFLSPRWPEERYKYFYQSEYDSYYRPSIFTAETDSQKYENIKTICSRLENLHLIEGRESVLDIGAGMGWSLQWLKQNYTHFQRLAAVESSKHCITNLQDVVGASVIADNVDTDWKSEGFDLVIMRHVLEHLMNPVVSLNKMGDNLSANGIIYIAVPDMMNPKGSLNNYWFRSVHTFYFSERTLDSIASIANLQLIEMKGENSELWGVFRKSTNTAQKQSGCNVYEKQIRIIKEHQRKAIFVDAKYKIIQIILCLLPSGIKTWLKNQYHRAKQ